MKTKTLFLALLFFSAAITNAQITYSITIPKPIPNFNGTFDDFGQNHFYYPSGDEMRFADREHTNAAQVVKYYTMNTYPKKFLLNNNNLSLCYSKGDSSLSKIDSLQRIDIEWQNSDTNAFLARVDTQTNARLNYFTQWFSSAGRTDVMGSAAIACQSLYSNIDLVYTSNNSGLVMYFIVYPGGNYKDILMHINGSKANSIVSNKLKIEADWEYTTLEKPQMYQYTISGGTITPVNVCNASWYSMGSDTYVIDNATTYDTLLPIIIQVKQANALSIHTAGLKWSTYFGGTQLDFLTKTHCDDNDNLYVAGYTSSNDFPQAPGAIGNLYNNGDGIIAKFDNFGVFQWSTFIGGSGSDEIHDFDFNGNSIFCVGKTSSPNLPVFPKTGATNNASIGGTGWDGFIFEFEFNSVSVIGQNWLTYFGGNGDDELNACKFDVAGNFFVVGASASTDMTPMGPSGSYQQSYNTAQVPLTYPPAATDAIIAKFNAGTSLQSWFTFYGTDALGTNANTYAADYFYGLSISGTDLYACGKAGGSNLPNSINSKLVSGNFDGMLTHFTTGGIMSGSDAKFTDGNVSNYAVKVHWDRVYTVGEANSTMSPTNSSLYYYNGTSSGNSDGCFSVHSLDLSNTIHNSFLGGNGEDAAYDIQFTSNDLFYISGGTNSSDFPTNNLSPTYSNTGNPNSGIWLNDNFISCFQIDNTSLIWSSYLGSNYQESLFYPVTLNTPTWPALTTMALNSQNYLHVLGVSTSYNTFPRDEWTGFPVYFQPTKNGSPVSTTNEGTITRFDVVAINAIVGIKDFKNTEFVFGIYPNPTSKNIRITHPFLANEDLRYAVYDMSGKKLKEGKLKATETKDIDVAFLPQGVYVINVSNGKKTYSNKFVKTDN